MFGLLKNKLSGFVDGIVGRKKKDVDSRAAKDGVKKVEKKEDLKAQIKPEQKSVEIEVEKKDSLNEKPKPKAQIVEQEVETVVDEPKEVEMPTRPEHGTKMPLKTDLSLEEIEEEKEGERTASVDKREEKKKSVFDMAAGLFSKKPEQKAAFERVEKTRKKPAEKKDIEFETPQKEIDAGEIERLEKKALDDKKEMRVKVGVSKGLGSIFSSKIIVEKKDVEDLLDELELALIEADVGLDVSEEVKNRLEKKLVGLSVDKSKMQQQVNDVIKEVLWQIMSPPNSFDFWGRVQSAKKPVKILFVGPNGSGKTTTIAKFAKLFENKGMSVCLAAADTFRAAAIEQLSEHGQRLGVPVIKSRYGADPASVAFDAIKHARTHNLDVVLIDSAGRQDTNVNLIDEMKKIERVVSPDMKIYIGESIGGSALIEQVRAFEEAIGLDGAVLTKLDCDAKGGTAISLSYSTGVPILFLGVGQEYSDLRAFDAKELVEQILG